MTSFVWWYIWPAASTLDVVVTSGVPFVRKHIFSVMAPDTVRPNAAHTTTITPIIFLGYLSKGYATPASLSYIMPHSKVTRADSPSVAPPRPPAPVLLMRCARAFMKSLFTLKRL